MEDFKIIKIRDQGVEKRIFVLCFKLCTRGVYFKLRVGFFCFLKMGFFEECGNLIFEDIRQLPF